MNKNKVTVSWSGGKDSAFALYKLRANPEFEVVNLHTTLGEETKRVGLHGVREELIEAQARALNLPLVKLYLQASDDHKIYEQVMKTYYQECVDNGISHVLFGDIFLEDLKVYRENLLAPSGLQPLYPLWKQDTKVLIREFLQAGFKTTICSANADFFSQEQVGVTITDSFVDQLPASVDPCGERGEFHTFVFDAPFFAKHITHQRGEIVSKKYSYKKKLEDDTIQVQETSFWFQDLLPLNAS